MEEKTINVSFEEFKGKRIFFLREYGRGRKAKKNFARYLKASTVTPLLSGPPIKRTPSIKRTLSRSRNERLIFPFMTNPYSADTSIKRTRTLK